MITRIFTGRMELLQYIIVVAFSILIFSVPITLATPLGFNPLYDLFYSFISGNTIAIKGLFIVLVSGIIVLTQVFFDQLNIIERNNRYLFLIAPMLMFSNESAWVLSPALISLAFIVVGTSFIFKISEDDKSIKKLSSAALLYSIGALFYSVNIFAIIVLIVAVNIFRQVSLRDIVAVMFSFILPYVYLFVYYFVVDKFELKYEEFKIQFSEFGIGYSFQVDTVQWVFYILLAIVSGLVIFSVLVNLRNSLIQVRKYMSFIFWGLLNTSFLFLFANDNISQHLIILMYLVSLFYVFFLNKRKKNWITDSVFILFLAYDLFLIYNILIVTNYAL